MGVIRKQGVWSTLFIYVGFLFGFLNAVILFPRFVSPEVYGLTVVIIDAGKFISSFALFGMLSVIVKFSPFYKTHLGQKENDLLSFTLLVALVGFALTFLVINWQSEFIIRKFGANSPLFVEYFDLIYPLTFFLLIYSLFETYASIYYYTRIGSFLREVGVRIFVSILLLMVAAGWMMEECMVFFYSFQYMPVWVILFGFLLKKQVLSLQFKPSYVTRKFKKKIAEFAAYMQGGILLSVAAITVDSIFIASMGGLPKVATFTIGRYFSELVQAPYRAFSAISAPIISEAWKNKDMRTLEDIYSKTSLNQLIAAVLVFGEIWINMDWILVFLGQSFAEAKPVFLILGLTRIIDLGAGLNAEILGTSPKWRFNFISQAIMMFIFIPVNYIFLKHFGIVGSALASMIAFFVYNLVRYIFIYRFYRLQPFRKSTLIPVLLGIVFLGSWEMLSIKWRSGLAISMGWSIIWAVYYLGIILKYRVSADINLFLGQLLSRFRKN